MTTQSLTSATHHTCETLLKHLSTSFGLFARHTVEGLYSILARQARQASEGVVFCHLPADAIANETFESLAQSLFSNANLQIVNCQHTDVTEIQHLGILLILTPDVSGLIFWTTRNEPGYRQLESGWFFNPPDVLQAAKMLCEHTGIALSLPETAPPISLKQRDSLLSELLQQYEIRNRELMQLEEDMKHLNTKMLDQERLAAIGQLCSVIAHEIRNPLGLIDLYAKLIEHQMTSMNTTDDKTPMEQNLKLIRSASQDLERILSELTSYSRPLELETFRTDLTELVRDVVAMYEPRYEEAGVVLKSDIQEQPIWLNIDRGRVRQALINLIKNALEASLSDNVSSAPSNNSAPRSPKHVDVILAPRKNDKLIYIKVYDQGRGVDEKYRAKLFTPYFSTKGNGTGLGLAHSKKILQAHGGTVELLKTSPEGSAFALVLPNLPV